MARPPSIHWCDRDAAFRSDVGPRSPSGRRTTVYFREDGQGAIRKSDRARALAALAAYLAARDRTERGPGPGGLDPTCADLAELYLAARAREAKPRTVQGHRERLTRWLREAGADGVRFGDRRASSVTAEDLMRVIRDLLAHGYAPNYVAGITNSVKACWAWAARPVLDRVPGRLLATDPLAAVKPPPLGQPPARYVSPEQAGAMLDWIDRRFRDEPGPVGRLNRRTALLFRFIYATGCRPDEAARLTWGDLDWETRVATLAVHKTDAKTGRPRKIAVPADWLERLRADRDAGPNHPVFVFTHKRGRGSVAQGATLEGGVPWKDKALQHRWHQLRGEAIADGLDIPPDLVLYDFRRSWQADGIEHGYTAEQIGQAAGTSARMVDRVYASARERQLADMADAIAARRKPAGPGAETEDGR